MVAENDVTSSLVSLVRFDNLICMMSAPMRSRLANEICETQSQGSRSGSHYIFTYGTRESLKMITSFLKVMINWPLKSFCEQGGILFGDSLVTHTNCLLCRNDCSDHLNL
jgi:hypothetical protein